MKNPMAMIAASCLLAGLGSGALAQGAYPSQPVTAVVGYAPGGAADLIMRQLAILMADRFPQGLVVLNKPGGGGSTAVSTIAQAKPDGYQFAFVPNSNLALSPQIHNLNYKTPDDIEPIINMVRYSPLLVVARDSPFKSAKDVVDAARKARGTVSIGYPGDTTLSHLNVLELERAAEVDFVKVPFTGWGQGSPQLLGGHIAAAVAQPTETASFMQAGTVRALGSFSEKRQATLPQIPTMAEQGFPVALGVRYLLITTKGTPPATVKYIHDAAEAAMRTPKFKEFADASGLELAYQDGPTARKAAWDDYKRYAVTLKQLGLGK